MGFNVHAQQIKEKLKKAKKGDLEAQLSLAYDYSFGGPVGRNKKKAFRWYLCAAKQGSAKGQFNVGSGYLFGLGVKKKPKEAFEWFCRAAAQDYALAYDQIAYCYKEGHGVKRNYKEAMRYYLIAIEKGCEHSYRGIGELYEYGYGVEKDLVQALSWYKKGKEKGDFIAGLEAMRLAELIAWKKSQEQKKENAAPVRETKRADVKSVAADVAGGQAKESEKQAKVGQAAVS